MKTDLTIDFEMNSNKKNSRIKGFDTVTDFFRFDAGRRWRKMI